MKRSTALKYCVEIARRLREIDGKLLTPGYSHAFVVFEKVWVFGSTAKGSEAPNDVDILIHFGPSGKFLSVDNGGIVDKAYLRRYGIERVHSAEDFSVKWLSKGMKKVSRHSTLLEGDMVFPEKKEIYPNYTMDLT